MQHRVLKIGRKFMQWYQYKIAVLYFGVRHHQLMGCNDFFIVKKDININDTGCIFFGSYTAHLSFNGKNGVH